MKTDLFEQLISEEESETLDFKSENYDFSGNTDSEKKEKTAKFIKDIISFANTPRSRSAYIILGVQEQNGEKIFHGIDVHIDDATYQDKIKKASPIPKLSYHSITYQDKKYGIIEIPIVKYPDTCKVKSKFKGLEVGKVYFRRGSQNDEAKEHDFVKIHNWLNSLDDNLIHNEIPEVSISDLITAYENSEFETGNNIFKQLENQAEDEEEKTMLKYRVYCIQYTNGIQDADKKINEIIDNQDDDELKAHGYYYLGLCYDTYDSNKAIIFYEKAKSCTKNQYAIAVILNKISNCYYKQGKNEKSINTLLNILSELTESESLFLMYQNIASYYEKENDTLLKILALRKALEIKPNDTSLIFKVAYGYSNLKVNGLGYNLYQKLSSAMSMNNSAVILHKSELKGKSNELYKKAHEKGETLSASNLAYQYINAGFYEEAKQVLDDAMKSDDIHENVYGTYNKLQEKINEEDEKLKRLKKNGQIQDNFFKEYVNAHFKYLDNFEIKIEGKWKVNGRLVEVTIDEYESHNIEWEDYSYNYELSGYFDSFASELSYQEQEKDKKDELPDTYPAYCYLNETQTELNVLVIKDNENIKYKFIKNVNFK